MTHDGRGSGGDGAGDVGHEELALSWKGCCERFPSVGANAVDLAKPPYSERDDVLDDLPAHGPQVRMRSAAQPAAPQ